MSLIYKFIVLILISLKCLNLTSQSGIIKGQINLDTTIWTPVVYLSIIPDFDAINTMSNEMIIEKANVDASGKFSFNILYFPKEDNFYRVHIPKKSDPPASLIIGGKDENHFFLIANNRTTLWITDTSNSEFIKDVKIDGYYPNQMIHQINEITTYLDSTSFNGSTIKNELIRNAIFEKLRYYADTCSNPLVSLYALYKSKFEKNYPINQEFYKNFLLKWKKEQSSYFVEFRKKIPFSRNLNTWLLILICGSAFIVGVFVSIITFKIFKKDQNPIHDLSLQERKIFALIIDGKSNKEISDLLNIGLSTVKSHINSIYSKLDINSRKDILNLNLDNKDKF